MEVGFMGQQATEQWKVVREFAADYLLPAFGVMLLVLVGLGFLALTGIVVLVAIPVAIVLIILYIAALLTSEMVWRLSTLLFTLGFVALLFALASLIRDPILTVLGGIIGGLLALSLHWMGHLNPYRERAKQTGEKITDPMGQTRKVLLLKGDQLNFDIGVGSLIGLLVAIICWGTAWQGTMNVFWGLCAVLAFGRALSWFSLEEETGVTVYWRPYPFLRHFLIIRYSFDWWHRARRFLGFGLGHWVTE